MPTEDDLALFDRWQAGDAAAGEALVERYFDAIYRFFHSKLEAEADELVQATFLACLAAKDRFRRESSFRTFLYAIAKLQLYGALRTKARDARHDDLELASIEDLVTTPRTVLARQAAHARLADHLRRLPVAQQTLLELHYWDDLGIAELSEIFEVAEVTMRSRLHRARQALRDRLLADPECRAFAASFEAMEEQTRGLVQRTPASRH